MKSALLKQTGVISDLKKNLVTEEIEIPGISEEDVLIKIIASSLNRRDYYITKGLYSKIKLPVVLGSDCCGEIYLKGKNTSGFSTGDSVIINPGMNWGDNENFQSKDFRILGMPDNGTLAEYISINQKYVYQKPSHLTFDEAASIPLAGVTAFRALFKKGEVKKNENVLITGIGGGVATFAMLFAIAAGANVFVTSSVDEKIKKAISFGAKGGANYKNKYWDEEIMELAERSIDVIIDSAGGEGYSKFPGLINYGGRIISYGAITGSAPDVSLHKVYWKQLKLMGSTMGSDKDFSEMIDFINMHTVIPIIDTAFSLENVCDAFKRMDESDQFGKIVIQID